MKKRGKALFWAIATLIGTIIGAGVFSIPYVFAQAGFLVGTINLIVLGAAVLILYFYTGEVVLRTSGNHQLTGYAKRYLGKTGKSLMTFTMMFAIYGALVAYIMGVGMALAAIFGFSATLPFSIGFFILAALAIYTGLKAVKESELWLNAILLIVIIAICLIIIPRINLANLAPFDFTQIFLPYGVIFFALAGSVAIPEMKEVLTKNRKQLKKAILIGALIPLAIYFIFALIVVGVTGTATTEIATIGLGQTFGKTMILLGNLFAVFAMATSFLTLGLALKEMYWYDYKMNKNAAWLLTCVPPLLIFLFLARSFIQVIGITGGIAMSLEGILLVLIFNRAKKLGNRKPEYTIRKSTVLNIVLITLFILGMIYTILNSIGVI